MSIPAFLDHSIYDDTSCLKKSRIVWSGMEVRDIKGPLTRLADRSLSNLQVYGSLLESLALKIRVACSLQFGLFRVVESLARAKGSLALITDKSLLYVAVREVPRSALKIHRGETVSIVNSVYRYICEHCK